MPKRVRPGPGQLTLFGKLPSELVPLSTDSEAEAAHLMRKFEVILSERTLIMRQAVRATELRSKYDPLVERLLDEVEVRVDAIRKITAKLEDLGCSREVIRERLFPDDVDPSPRLPLFITELVGN